MILFFLDRPYIKALSRLEGIALRMVKERLPLRGQTAAPVAENVASCGGGTRDGSCSDCSGGEDGSGSRNDGRSQQLRVQRRRLESGPTVQQRLSTTVPRPVFVAQCASFPLCDLTTMIHLFIRTHGSVTKSIMLGWHEIALYSINQYIQHNTITNIVHET